MGAVGMLTGEDLRRVRERLEAERATIESRMAARSRDYEQTMREDAGRGDSGDESFRVYDREFKVDVDVLDRATLAEIERALRRIEEGSYGVSEVSGKAIPIERLEAVPYAVTLVDEARYESC